MPNNTMDKITQTIIERRCSDLIAHVTQIESQITNNIRPAIKSIISNKESISLEIRWDIYTKLPVHYFDKGPWVQEFETIQNRNESWYDDYGIDKYQTVDNNDIIEQIEDNMVVDDEGNSMVDNPWTIDEVNALKEEMMSTGCREWTCDW